MSFTVLRPKVIGWLLAVLALPALACEMPDEGNMPLRRAVTKVRMLGEVDAWAEHMRRSKISVQYLLRLDAPVHQDGRCYWPVEVRGEGKLWRRYLVTPDGRKILFKE
jgi:hypothetical protein